MNNVELYLFARGIEWQHRLDEYSDAQVAVINKILDAARRELTRQLKYATITVWSEERTTALLDEIQAFQGSVRATITENVGLAAGIAGSAAYAAHATILSFNGEATSVTAVEMTAVEMTAVVKTVPVGGNLLSEWVDKTFSSNMKDKIKMEIAAGLINGSSYPAIVKRLDDGWPGTRTSLKTLVRTYVSSVNSMALQDIYEANRDIIRSVQWRAAMSTRTCLRCAGLDGHIYKIDDHPSLPLHPNCRCTLIPKTDQGALGLSNEVVEKAARPYSIENRKIKGVKGNIAAGTWAGDYESFIHGMTPVQQRDFLGPKRLELINTGKVTFDDLVDKKNGRIRLLSELAK